MRVPYWFKSPIIRGLRGLRMSEWLPENHAKAVAHADHLKALFSQHRIDAVLDVGGNLGQFAMMLRMMTGYRGWIFSFEPNPAVARQMTQRLRHDRHWRLFQYALGREEGTLPLQLTRATEFASFLPPNAESSRLFGDLSEVTATIDVPVKTLATALAEARSLAPCMSVFLKLDTQGFDSEILKGAGETLRTIAMVQTELSFRPIYEGSSSWEDVKDYLRGMGFQLSGLFPVNASDVGALVEADGIFVNEQLRSGTTVS